MNLESHGARQRRIKDWCDADFKAWQASQTGKGTMKITIKELLESQVSLHNIGALRLNTTLKFRLARVIKQVTEALSDMESAKLDLCKREGGTMRADKSRFDFPDEETEDRVNEEYRQLIQEHVEIRFDKFSEETFAKLELSSIDIANAWWLFAGSGDWITATETTEASTPANGKDESPAQMEAS